MLEQVTEDKIRKVIEQLEINFKRLHFAYSKIIDLLPLDINDIKAIEGEKVSFIDQYIFRFSKIQDLMGDKLFRILLNVLGEDPERMAFIDILSRLEKLSVIPDKDEWLYLRQLRNEVSHEYPLIDEDTVAGLNGILNAKSRLEGVFRSCKDFLEGRGTL